MWASVFGADPGVRGQTVPPFPRIDRWTHQGCRRQAHRAGSPVGLRKAGSWVDPGPTYPERMPEPTEPIETDPIDAGSGESGATEPVEKLPRQLTGPLVEQSATVPLPRDAVWTLLTTGEGIRAWYTLGGGAEVDARPGGRLALWWEPESTFLGRVVTVEAPRRFDYRLAHGANVSPQLAESTLVQFRITDADEPGHTLVEVRESGFDKLSEPKESFTASSLAWVGALGMLQQLAMHWRDRSSGEATD